MRIVSICLSVHVCICLYVQNFLPGSGKIITHSISELVYTLVIHCHSLWSTQLLRPRVAQVIFTCNHKPQNNICGTGVVCNNILYWVMLLQDLWCIRWSMCLIWILCRATYLYSVIGMKSPPNSFIDKNYYLGTMSMVSPLLLNGGKIHHLKEVESLLMYYWWSMLSSISIYMKANT